MKVKGPRFRSAKINPNRKLNFKANRKIPFGKRGVRFRTRGVKFGDRGVSNIELEEEEDPIKLNNRGIMNYNKGKYKIALKYFDKAIAVAPQFDEAKKNRFYCIKMIREKHEQERVSSVQKSVLRVTKPIRRVRGPQQAPVEAYPISYPPTSSSQSSQTYPYPSHPRPKELDYLEQLGWATQKRRRF